MNLVKTLTLSILAMSLAFGGEADTKLPASAQAVLDKAEAAVAANRAAYDKANVKPLADAEKALKAEMDKATKAGKLNDALAIQKVLEGLRESVVASVDEKAKEKGDLLGEAKVDLAKAIVGEWKASVKGWRDIVVVDSKLNASFGNVTGKMVVGDGMISVKWSHNFIWKDIKFNADTKTFTGSCFFPTGVREGDAVLAK